MTSRRGKLAIAAGTQRAADCANAILAAGGNAADAAIAATFLTWVCEPGITSPGGGAFATVWFADQEPIVIDGFVDMPGRSASADRFGREHRITMPYGGGVTTIIGASSVAVPGSLAAVEQLSQRFGRMAWSELIKPAIDAARNGFEMPRVSTTYFQASGDTIFAHTPDAHALARHADGTDYKTGDTATQSDLADALAVIADEGAAAFYEGDIGRTIADWIDQQQGLLGLDDLQAYAMVERAPLTFDIDGWHVATTPPPAIGGKSLRELLRAFIAATEDPASLTLSPWTAWSADHIAHFAEAMHTVYRNKYDTGEDHVHTSPSTSHVSVVDSAGNAVSITSSTGYSSGIIVPGTGILLNNMLGELELCPQGYHGQPPGARLQSNMAPCIARNDDGDVVAVGSGGAERITSALAQFWINTACLEMDATAAVDHPRCHLELRDDVWTLAHEPGIDVSRVAYPTRRFDDVHMFFGGMQAAGRTADGELTARGDPRRGGGQRIA